MKELTNETIRYALRNFGKGGEEISHAMLFEAFGLTEERDKARLRNRINDMARMGEVVKVRPGVYTYNFGYRPRENRSLPAIWRFVRKAKPRNALSWCGWITRGCCVTRPGSKNRDTSSALAAMGKMRSLIVGRARRT